MYSTRLSQILASSALFVVAACGDGRVQVPGAGAEGAVGGDCRDGADNDEDGLFDCDDDGCAASPDCEGSDENAAPSGAAIAIEPAAPTDADDLTCTIVTEATDPNGDALTYRYAWAVNGADAGISGATVGAALTSGGDIWTCTVTPNDGVLDGAPTSVSVTIAQGNRAPSAPGVSITPAAPTDDDVLTCVIDTESVDPDGDAVTYSYAWSVDGVDAGVSAASVNSTRTTAGETWTCSVTANDGDMSGAPGTASVEVGSACHSVEYNGTTSASDTDGSLLAALDGLTTLTVEAWVYNLGPGESYRNIVRLGDDQPQRGIMLRVGASETDDPTHNLLEGFVQTTIGNVHVASGSPIALDAWVHVAMVYDGAALRLYVNGVQTSSAALTGAVDVTGTSTGIGYWQSRDSERWNGQLSNVRISSSARYTGSSFTPATVLGADARTVVAWPLDEGSGATSLGYGASAVDLRHVSTTWSDICPE